MPRNRLSKAQRIALGMMRTHLGDAQAIAVLERAVAKIRPNWPIDWDTLGLCLIEIREKAEAHV